MPGAGGGDGKLVFSGDRVSLYEDEKVLEMDGSDGCRTMGMYLRPQNHTLKIVNMVTFVMYFLSQYKNSRRVDPNNLVDYYEKWKLRTHIYIKNKPPTNNNQTLQGH